jgi:hypothetical protein
VPRDLRDRPGLSEDRAEQLPPRGGETHRPREGVAGLEEASVQRESCDDEVGERLDCRGALELGLSLAHDATTVLRSVWTAVMSCPKQHGSPVA